MPRPSRLLLTVVVSLLATPSAAGVEPGGTSTRHTEVAVAAAPGGGSYVPGEDVVRYARDADRRERAAVQRDTGVGDPRVFAPRTRVLQIRDGDSVAETVRELRARPEVASAAPNTIARIGRERARPVAARDHADLVLPRLSADLLAPGLRVGPFG